MNPAHLQLHPWSITCSMLSTLMIEQFWYAFRSGIPRLPGLMVASVQLYSDLSYRRLRTRSRASAVINWWPRVYGCKCTPAIITCPTSSTRMLHLIQRNMSIVHAACIVCGIVAELVRLLGSHAQWLNVRVIQEGMPHTSRLCVDPFRIVINNESQTIYMQLTFLDIWVPSSIAEIQHVCAHRILQRCRRIHREPARCKACNVERRASVEPVFGLSKWHTVGISYPIMSGMRVYTNTAETPSALPLWRREQVLQLWAVIDASSTADTIL